MKKRKPERHINKPATCDNLIPTKFAWLIIGACVLLVVVSMMYS